MQYMLVCNGVTLDSALNDSSDSRHGFHEGQWLPLSGPVGDALCEEPGPDAENATHRLNTLGEQALDLELIPDSVIFYL